MGKPKRPTDVNQRAKLVVDIATGEAEPDEPESEMAKRGRKGGEKGGKARAEALTAENRAEAAKKAAQARWTR